MSACFVTGYVHAQSATGSIFGEAKSGASVTIENVDTGLKRSINADSSGRYRFPELPNGHYKVSSGQGTRDVMVKAGTGSEVNFATAAGEVSSLGTVTVSGTAINPIDVSSVESVTVFTDKQLAALPVQRDISRVALLAPGTVKGDAGFGNGHLVSFGGSSVAENGYYINGFDVTNIHDFLSYATLPFDAIAQEQVKTGGYGAEYGRSLGGVISITTQRGSNEWKAGGTVTWEPDALREQSPNVANRTGSDFHKFTKANKETDFTYDAYVSGPLVKDTLFVYAMLEGRSDTTDTYGHDTSRRTENTKPHGLLKLDWNISDHHILEFTGISNRDYDETQNYDNASLYSTKHDTPTAPYTTKNGGEVYIGKYTGYLTDTLTLSAQYGQLKSLNSAKNPRNGPGADCPRVLDGRTVNNGSSGALVYQGCYDLNNVTINDPLPADPYDRRRAGRIDLDWKVGDHSLRGGLDGEKFTSTDLGYQYSGGAYWRYYVYKSGKVNGVTPPAGTTQYVRRWLVGANSGSYDVNNTAAYIEDSWQVTDRWLVYGGLREETFDNKDGLGRSMVKSSNQLAPRVGFSWDVNGDASDKLSGSLGRYYIPVASNTNLRASRAERFVVDYFTFTGIDPRTYAPTGLTQLGNTIVNEQGNIPVPGTYASTSLKPMYQDELILGFQHALSDKWAVGTRAVVRRVGAGMDDFCWGDAFTNWANDNGYKNFDVSTVPSCVLLNPGRDNKFRLDLNNDGKLTEVNVPAKYFMLPKYKRRYNALELFLEKQWDEKWYLQGSYTWSHIYGNTEGYVDSNFVQADPGTTANFDYPSVMNGQYGNLANDHTHVFKLFGVYQIAPTWRLSGNALVESGAPKACIGFLPLDPKLPEGVDLLNQINNLYGATTYYCNAGTDSQGNAIQALRPRGSLGRTPWIKNFDFGVTWMPHVDHGNFQLKLDIFNLFNQHGVLRYQETHDVTPANPQADQNYGLPNDFQQPRFVRLSARYDF